MNTAHRGFTLLEVVVYLGLYAMLFFGVLVGVYALKASHERNIAIEEVDEEGNYIAAKIDWILEHTAAVEESETSGPVITVSETDGTTVTISAGRGNVSINRDGVPGEPLAPDVTVTDLSFARTHASDGSGDRVAAVFTVSAATSQGAVVSRVFSTMDLVP